MFLLIAIICLMMASLVIVKAFKSRHKGLQSPGISLPIIGHSYKLFTKSAMENLTDAIWKIYRKYNRKGILYVNIFSVDIVWIGDFDTIKYLFNHPSAIPRLNKNEIEFQSEARKISGKEMTGVILSEGYIWHQQRRFTLRTLRDFGFGKMGKKSSAESIIDDLLGLVYRVQS